MKIDKRKECISCGNKENNRVFSATEKMFGFGHSFDYLECSYCGSLQLIDIPKNPDQYYPTNYYAFGGIVKSNFFKNIIKKLRWKLSSKGWIKVQDPDYLSWLKNLNAKPKERIADIGCGNGQLLYELKCSGFRNLYGFDPYLSNEIKEDGLVLQRKSYDEIDQTFDIVMMHHSFEHMEDPKAVFEKLSQIISENGRLLIRVPITDGLAWKKNGINWFQLDAPRHLFIPSVQAMEMLSTSFDFKLQKIIFDSGSNQFWGPVIYQKGLSYSGTNLSLHFSDEDFKKFEKDAALLNESKQGDQACFYFEKR